MMSPSAATNSTRWIVPFVAAAAVVLGGCGGPSDRNKLETQVGNDWERASLEECEQVTPTNIITPTGRESAYACSVRGLRPKERETLYMLSGVGLGEEPKTRLRDGDRLFYVPATTAIRICFIVRNQGGPAEAWNDVDMLGAMPKAGGRCAGAETASSNPTRTQ